MSPSMSTAVGFSSATLLAPYQEIIAGGSTNWVIYGLTTTSASNELKLVDSGTGGLEELEDEFGGGQVLWAFVRVKDPGSGLNKFVLINWLGEGVPDAKKGLFPSHSAAVAKFLKGSVVTFCDSVLPDAVQLPSLSQRTTRQRRHAGARPQASCRLVGIKV